MAVLWTLTPIPIPITSLFPIVLLPLLGLASTETACSAYLKANNMLFLGCLALALAVEKSNLHQRIALKVLLHVKAEFKLILLCFMLTTMCFSMWIVSTATVAMMLPIADEIFSNLFPSNVNQRIITKQRRRTSSIASYCSRVPSPHSPKEANTTSTQTQATISSMTKSLNSISISLPLPPPPPLSPRSIINGNSQQPHTNGYSPSSPTSLNNNNHHNKWNSSCMMMVEEEREQFDLLSDHAKTKIYNMFYLCIAYSATIGSVSTLTANGPNLIMKDILEKNFDNRDPVDYASWMLFATPASIISTLVCWKVFTWLYFSKVVISQSRQRIIRQHIVKKYDRLGPITFHEFAVLFVFMVMILLYFFYKPQFISGWSTLFEQMPHTSPRPASAAIFCVILLFFIPAKLGKGNWNPDLKTDALLDWATIQTKLEWGVLFIRGGGFAMADAVKSSGLSELIGTQLSQLGKFLPSSVLILAISTVANFIIEFMRTSASASILIPVAIKLSSGLNLNPLKLVIPLTTSCAYAFISPVGTTTNTIIYCHCNLSIKDMIIPGLIAKLITMSIMLVNIYLFGNLTFDIDNQEPEWAMMSNSDYSQYSLPIISSSYDILSNGTFANTTTTPAALS